MRKFKRVISISISETQEGGKGGKVGKGGKRRVARNHCTELGVSNVAESQVIGSAVVPANGDQSTPPAVGSAKTPLASPTEPAMWVQVRAVRSRAPSITLPGLWLVIPLTPVDENDAEVLPLCTPPPLSIPSDVDISTNSVAWPPGGSSSATDGTGKVMVLTPPWWPS